MENCSISPQISGNLEKNGKSMKKTQIWLLLGVLSLASAAWTQAQQSSVGTEKAIVALENQWLQSYKTNNPDLAAPLLADKFVATGIDGKVSERTQFLSDARAIKFTSAEYENLKVTVFGNTAIATGGFKGKGTDGKGKPFDDHSSWTDTWVKMPNGKWQCVASQDSPITM
jgi:ketosteroid isomerase-like protein